MDAAAPSTACSPAGDASKAPPKRCSPGRSRPPAPATRRRPNPTMPAALPARRSGRRAPPSPDGRGAPLAGIAIDGVPDGLRCAEPAPSGRQHRRAQHTGFGALAPAMPGSPRRPLKPATAMCSSTFAARPIRRTGPHPCPARLTRASTTPARSQATNIDARRRRPSRRVAPARAREASRAAEACPGRRIAARTIRRPCDDPWVQAASATSCTGQRGCPSAHSDRSQSCGRPKLPSETAEPCRGAISRPGAVAGALIEPEHAVRTRRGAAA